MLYSLLLLARCAPLLGTGSSSIGPGFRLHLASPLKTCPNHAAIAMPAASLFCVVGLPLCDYFDPQLTRHAADVTQSHFNLATFRAASTIWVCEPAWCSRYNSTIVLLVCIVSNK